MRRPPRVALLTDCFHEVNGAAHTLRQLESYAARHALPFLCIRCGRSTRRFESGSVQALELKRSWAAFSIDVDFGYDPLLWRHSNLIRETLAEFRPDVVHIISPGDFGELGAYWAYKLRIPLVASFHTNIHQYAAARLDRLVSFIPRPVRARLIGSVERLCKKGLIRFYQIPRLLLAPNTEIQDWLTSATGKPCRIMGRGVDTYRFNPVWRDTEDGVLRLGYVGRLKLEKSVRFLAEIERALLAAGHSKYRFLIVGEGSERPWLERNLKHAEFTGVLHGKRLARAYANMDVFLFPSRTDAFGNVVLEAMASGVPPVVTASGGPKHVVQPGVAGFAALDDREFIRLTLAMASDATLRRAMGAAARRQACSRSWDSVFESVYEAYAECIESGRSNVAAIPVDGLPVSSLQDGSVDREAVAQLADRARNFCVRAPLCGVSEISGATKRRSNVKATAARMASG